MKSEAASVGLMQQKWFRLLVVVVICVPWFMFSRIAPSHFEQIRACAQQQQIYKAAQQQCITPSAGELRENAAGQLVLKRADYKDYPWQFWLALFISLPLMLLLQVTRRPEPA